jgi:hypothetical protein
MKPSAEEVGRSPARRLAGRVELCLIADGADFVSRTVETITLDFNGIVGDHHAGATREASSREPWFPRGALLRNDRQVSIVSAVELADVARAMKLPGISPGWIGANVVLADIPAVSFLPAGTKLLFAGGAVLNVEGENHPCRVAGKSIGAHLKRDGLDLLFPKMARHKRGLVASVDKAGLIRRGDAVEVRIPEQRIYSPEPALL